MIKKLSIFFCVLIPQLLFSSADKPKIAVIGAGLAGLTAAYRLQEQGCSVVVYEARARAGGRVLTLYSQGSHEELGGKFLNDGGDGDRICALAQELGLEVESYEMDYTKACLYQNQACSYHSLIEGCPFPNEDLRNSLKAQMDRVQNLGEFLDIFYQDAPLLRHFVEIRMRNFEGSETSALSPYYFDSFWNFYQVSYALNNLEKQGKVGSYQVKTIRGGNCLLIEELCKRLKGCIDYNVPLAKLSRESEGKFRLFFHNRDSIVVDYVLLALPCAILKAVEVDPEIIPEDQWHAIQTMQYGTNAKMLLPVILPAGKFSEFAYTNQGVLWFNRDHSMMTCYYGGPAGLFPKGLHHFFSQEASAIEKLYPGIFLDHNIQRVDASDKPYIFASTPVGMCWSEEEFSKGSYSFFSAKEPESIHRIEQDWQEDIRSAFRSIDNAIFFAGEHTAVNFPATMEGAVESGEKAARMLTRAISNAHDHNQKKSPMKPL